MNHPIISSMVNIEFTNICPARCIICPRDAFESKLGIMGMTLFKKIIDDIAQYNCACVNTCGFGDPFTDKYFFERCAYIKDKLPDTKIYASTTGYLMDEKYYTNIIKYIDILKISFFGMTEEVYKKMHGIKLYPSLSNILKLLYESRYAKKKPYISGLFVETEINKHQRQKWIDYWGDKFDEIYVFAPHNWLDKRYRIIDKTKQISCGRPSTTVYVHVDGKVSPCCWDLNKKLIIGDLNHQVFKEIMDSKELKYIQTKHINNDFEGLICDNCDQTNLDDSNLLYTNKGRKIGQYAYEV